MGALALPVGAAPAGAGTTPADPLRGTGVVVDLGPGAKAPPKVAVKSWVVFDLDTGEVLAAKNAHRLGRPASTIKTLTALTLMQKLDPAAVHVVTWEEAAAEGGRVGIVPDAEYTVRDLYHGLLLPSGNDAAAALAGANGGMRATVADMQAEAVRIGALDTVVKNSSGLDADGMVTSAFDLAIIARAAMEQPQFREVTATVSYDFPGRPAKKPGKKRPTYKIYTQNRLLLHGYDGAIGGKTGWTTKAGRTFWGAAERKGRSLGVTILQSTMRTEDAAKALLSWGFANATKVTPVGDLDPVPVVEQPDPGSSGQPSAGPAPGGDTALGGTAPAASSSSAGPWLAGGLVALAGIGAFSWWRRSAVSPRDASAVPRPPAPYPAAPAPAPEPEAAAPSAAPQPPATQPPAARPASTGHVKVIAPPSREPRDPR
jgi:D-alanyl-D-alanine carboxypeptidase (penicillin-binding protein 5/6)